MKVLSDYLLAPITINRHLQDVFGEQQQLLQLLVISLFGVLTPCLLLLLYPQSFSAVPQWKSVLAVILIADIAAGCIANFSRSTNNFYARHSAKRWGFIIIHWHLVILAFALEQTLQSSVIVTLYTLVAASIINLLRDNAGQKFYAGTLMALGYIGINTLVESSIVMSTVQGLFMFKVIFSFAVEHYGHENQ